MHLPDKDYYPRTTPNKRLDSSGLSSGERNPSPGYEHNPKVSKKQQARGETIHMWGSGGVIPIFQAFFTLEIQLL